MEESNPQQQISNLGPRTSNLENGIMVRLRGKVPREFFWKGRWRWVSAIEDEWVDTGEWWKGEGEKIFYRVVSNSQVYELYHDANENVWAVYQVYD